MRLNVAVLLSVCSLAAYAISDDVDTQEMKERIQPVGRVHVQEEANSSTQTKVEAPVEEKKEPGQATYEQYCVVCHRDGVAGAPKFRDAAWNSRMSGRTIKELVASATKGLNAMPPKGTCNDCSEADLEAAIIYMTPKK